jgi:ligand-binding sensor domain-containing protein
MNLFNQVIKIQLLIILLTFSCLTHSQEPSDKKNKSEKHRHGNKPALQFTSGIRSIFQDSQGRYWFGSDNHGVAVLDGKEFTYFDISDGLSGNQVRSIQEYHDGTIWFGTNNGVSRFDGQRIRQHHVTEDDSGLAFNVSDFTATYSDEDLWFNAGTQPGVYRLHNQKLSYLQFPRPDNADKQVYLLTDHDKGHQNTVWLATFSTVFSYNGNLLPVLDDNSLNQIKPINRLHVRSIFEDSQGRLWIGNNGIGVLQKNGNTLINFSKKMGLIHPASQGNGHLSPAGTLEHVFAIEEDNAGHIWFADRDTGIWKYDGQTMTNYNTDKGLSSNNVKAIYQDNKGGLWVGLNDGGVYLYKGGVFERVFGG